MDALYIDIIIWYNYIKYTHLLHNFEWQNEKIPISLFDIWCATEQWV